jgi:hypothetical protein
MSTGIGYERKRRRRGLIVLLLLLLLLVGYAVYLYLIGGRGGGGGGGGGNQTTTPGPTPPSNLLYPTRDVVNGYDLIVIEDHVHVENGKYSLVTSAVGSFRSLVAYGGSTVTGNITHGAAVIRYGGYEIPVVAFASTNSTIVQDFPGIQVRLDENGGYVFYKPISMAVYYRHSQFNISGTAVHVWVPTKTLPTRLADASVHVAIDPEFGVYYINNVAYSLELGTPPQKLKGVLRAWLVYTTASGRYAFTINP